MEDERERVRSAADSQGRAPGVDEVGHGRLGLKVKTKHSRPTGVTWQGKKVGLEKGSLPLSRGMNQKPARTDIIVLKQLLNFIPRSVLNQTARKTGVDTKARTFSVLSHLASMLFAQLSHAISLNDVCDWLRLKAAALSRLQIVPPSRNTLSHANKVRSADFSETLFWSVLAHLQHIQPGFASGKKGKGLLRRFKVR